MKHTEAEEIKACSLWQLVVNKAKVRTNLPQSLEWRLKARTRRNSFASYRSNLRPIVFWLKVRTRGPQPSICVRTFSLFPNWEKGSASASPLLLRQYVRGT